MFAHDFVRNAYLAGTFIALACGTTGWFVVLRGQLFAGDALTLHQEIAVCVAVVLPEISPGTGPSGDPTPDRAVR